MKKNKGEEEYLLKLGRNIRALRVTRNESQEEIAFKIGFARSYYVEIENGKRNVSFLNLLKIAKYFNVELNDLFLF